MSAGCDSDVQSDNRRETRIQIKKIVIEKTLRQRRKVGNRVGIFVSYQQARAAGCGSGYRPGRGMDKCERVEHVHVHLRINRCLHLLQPLRLGGGLQERRVYQITVTQVDWHIVQLEVACTAYTSTVIISTAIASIVEWIHLRSAGGP